MPAPVALLLRHDEISTSKGYTQWFSQANFLFNAEEGAFRQRGGDQEHAEHHDLDNGNCAEQGARS